MENYTLLEKIEESFHSVTYKGINKHDNKLYELQVIKLMDLNEEEKKQLLFRVDFFSQKKSEYIISFKEIFYDDDNQYLVIVIECADNGTLLQLINENKNKKNI